MKKLFAVALLLLVGVAFGQEKQNQCPVAFVWLRTHTAHQGNRYMSDYEAKYKNMTDKVIVGAKFNAAFYDPTNDLHEVAENWTMPTKLAPGKSATGDWEDSYYLDSYGLNSASEIWPIKVVFADGSVWEDDGSHSCKANSKDKSGNFVKKS